MEKAVYFFVLCLCVLGAIGGIGYALYGGAWPIAIGVATLTWAAFPKLKEAFEKLTK